jgi:hypothetical protein
MAELNQTNDLNVLAIPKRKAGRPKGTTGTSNLHAKHPSSIAVRLKTAGVDWCFDLAQAIKANDLTRINMWMKLLPYLIVTQGHRKPRRLKGKASKAAMAALDELEGR